MDYNWLGIQLLVYLGLTCLQGAGCLNPGFYYSGPGFPNQTCPISQCASDCSVGYYKSGCGNASSGTCLACSGPVAGAQFTTNGGQIDNCTQACTDSTKYISNGVCVARPGPVTTTGPTTSQATTTTIQATTPGAVVVTTPPAGVTAPAPSVAAVTTQAPGSTTQAPTTVGTTKAASPIQSTVQGSKTAPRTTSLSPTTTQQPATTLAPSTTPLSSSTIQYAVHFNVTISIASSVFDDTQYVQAIKSVASQAGCGVCGDPSLNPVQCDQCQILVVNMIYGATRRRRLLASTVTVDTKVVSPNSAVAAAVAQSLNTQQSMQTIQQLVGAPVVLQQPAAVVAETVQPAASSSDSSTTTSSSSDNSTTTSSSSDNSTTTIIIVAVVVGVLLAIIVVVVMVYVLNQTNDSVKPIPPAAAGPARAASRFQGQQGPLLGHRIIVRPPQQTLSLEPARPAQFVYRMYG